jgi:hypothetical protein
MYFLPPLQCKELNQLFGTEIAIFYSRGLGSHSYSPGSFVTKGAEKWVQTAEIGGNSPDGAAQQLGAFVASGLAKRVDKIMEGKCYIPTASYGI